MKTVRSFNYGRTVHAQPLTAQGRENWDKAFCKKEEEKKEPSSKEK